MIKVFHAAESIKGGVATVLSQLVDAQAERDADYEVVCLIPKNQARELRLNNHSARVLTFNRRRRSLWTMMAFLYEFIKILWSFRPDVVHLHSSFAGFLGRIALLLFFPLHRPKVIYCPHAFGFLMATKVWKKKIYALIERFLLIKTDIVICISRYEYSSALENGLDKKKLLIIENGIPAMKKGGRNPYDLSVFNVLYVGRFDYQKGFDVLLNAMNLLHDERIVLTAVGGGVHNEKEYLDEKNVRYTGWLPLSDISSYYEYADLLIVPSRWEGFGLVVVEAASFGVPSLASNCCSFPDLIVNGVTGILFEPNNHRELARYLMSISVEEWKTMGEAARKRYLKRYSSEKMIDGVFSLYDNLLMLGGK